MLRRILSVIIGFVVGFILVVLIQQISARMFPPPEDLLPQDAEAMERYFKSLPTQAWLIIVAAHFLGAFGSTFITALIADKSKLYMSLTVGTLMLLATISSDLSSFVPASIFALDMLTSLLGIYLGIRWGGGIQSRKS